MSLALAPAGQQRVQDLVRARPEGMQRVRRCLRRGSDWRALEIVAARCGMAIGTVRDQPDRWRCAEPGSVKDPKVSAFNAAKRAAAERELDALAERIYGLLEATALLARGTIARRLCAP